MSKKLVHALGVSLLIVLSAASHAQQTKSSSTVINIKLQDATNDPSMAGMKLAADQTSIKAGRVVFQVSNESKSVIHEMIVVKLGSNDAPLPYDEKTSKVVEAKINHLGEASDLKPGAKKSLTLTLQPGEYLLICNQAGHFRAGMQAPLTVTQ
jgi:uncharacterized cupredoxin-like copper-binding protein